MMETAVDKAIEDAFRGIPNGTDQQRITWVMCKILRDRIRERARSVIAPVEGDGSGQVL
jgi:hypothetical protein